MPKGPEGNRGNRGPTKEGRASKFDAKAERAAVTKEMLERVTAQESVKAYEPLLRILNDYDLLNDEKEREALARAYRKEREAFLAGPAPVEVPAAEPEAAAPIVEAAATPANDAKAQFVWKERPRVNRQALAVASEVRAYGLDPEQDLPKEWKRLSRANKAVRDALSAYESNAKGGDSDQRLLEQYHKKVEEFKAAREAIRAAVRASEPLLTKRTIAAHAIPLADELALYSSPDTFAGERNRMREPLMKRIEDALTPEPEPEPVTVPAVPVPAVPQPEQSVTDRSDGQPIVMLNPVLYKQAMGGTFKRLKNPNFPAMPVPDGMTQAGFIHKKEQNRKREELKRGLARWLPTGLVAGAAALWLFAAGDGEKNQQVEPSKKGTSAVAESTVPKSGPANFTSTPSTPFVPPVEAARETRAEPTITTEAPRPPEVRRIKKPPAVPAYARMSRQESISWDKRFNDWMRTYYPEGYEKARADTVRMEMVQALGYPDGKKAVARAEAPKPEVPEAQPPAAAPPAPAPPTERPGFSVEETFTRVS